VDITEEVREYLRMAQDAANQLLTLLNDVLDYSKMEAGKMVLERIEFSPRDVVKSVARMLAVKAHEKHLELLYVFAEDVPLKVVGDSYRLQQLLVNLVGNAIKFTERGEICISVSGNSEPRGQRLQFCIRDTGIGIEPDRQTGIFAPFTQADGSTTRKYGGTGLGLSICQQIVSLMCGEISIASTPGEGSAFTFDCLFERPAAEDSERQPAATPALRDKRILLLTSNLTAISILEPLLARWGMLPVAAVTADAAGAAFIAALERCSPFELIVADREFDSHHGFDVVESLRSRTAMKIPAIMMLSSVFIGSDLGRCRRLPLTGYILKPADANELKECVVQLLDPSKVESRTAASSTFVTSGPSLKILLAEDNAINRKLASTFLRKGGHEVVIVENGRDAVAQCEAQRFDVVFMDVQMPVMDGFEATACIRNSKDRQISGVPIIALTAHAVPGYREKCLKAGMNGYLTKPIDPSRLTEILSSYAGAGLVAQ
jgi:CheY-like chemotaxis protein